MTSCSPPFVCVLITCIAAVLFHSTNQQCCQLWKISKHPTSYPCNTYFGIPNATKSWVHWNVQSDDPNTLHYPSPFSCAHFLLLTCINSMYLHYDTPLQSPLNKISILTNPKYLPSPILCWLVSPFKFMTIWLKWDFTPLLNVIAQQLGTAASNVLSFPWLVLFSLYLTAVIHADDHSPKYFLLFIVRLNTPLVFSLLRETSQPL